MAELLQFASRTQYTGTWFWKSGREEWIKYGDQGLDPKYSSEKIEEAFKRGDKVFDFQHGYHYRIDFEVMKQVNISTGTRRDTKREITLLAQRSSSSGGLLESAEADEEEKEVLNVPNVPSGKGVTQFWQKFYPRWIENDIKGTDGGITSEANENDFQTKQKQIVFDLGKFRTIKEFAERKKNSFRIPTRRDVKREDHPPNQPRGSENVTEKKFTLESNIPHNWGRSQVSSDGFQLVSLSRQHSEYSMVQKLFAATMNTTIKNISRIQNVELWENFIRKKKWMSHNNEGHVEERLLFHGTSSKAITGICKMNFDMRLHGEHGSLYGKGVYFAKNATYSDRYVTDAQFSKQMILARVLVGEFVQGRGKYPRPPEKAGNILFDSCVDDISNPEIFVIFEKDQMYPEYLLEYEKE